MALNLIRTGKLPTDLDVFHKLNNISDRLQIVVAKTLQSLPELKRDGDNVLGSLWADLIYSENSTSRSGSILLQADFLPDLAKQLQDSPSEVVADFEEIRRYCKCKFFGFEGRPDLSTSNPTGWSAFLGDWQHIEARKTAEPVGQTLFSFRGMTTILPPHAEKLLFFLRRANSRPSLLLPMYSVKWDRNLSERSVLIWCSIPVDT